MTTTNSARALEATGSIERDAPSDLPQSHLPDKPFVVIEPSNSWAALNLRDLFIYRELLYFLTWRDVKVRYKQTILGLAWVVLQPLTTTLVFTVFLGILIRVPSDGIPYALFVYTGMLPWMFFTSAVTTSSNSLVGNSHLITKVYFPRMLIPISAIAARFVDFAITFVVLIALMAYYQVGATWRILMLVPLILLVTLLALGIGMLTSALNVRYRDIGVTVPLLLQLWMYASPIVYPASILPVEFQRLYILNPLVGIISGFRSSVLGQQFDWTALAVSTIFAAILLVCAAFSFRRMEIYFADII